MRLHKALTPLLLATLAAGCNDLDVTNPSQRTTETFYNTRNDALQAVNGAYHALQELGAYGRWQTFADDMRADVATSNSPWTDLANFTRTLLGSYSFEVNQHLWEHNFRAIYAANQVIANVPNVTMPDAEKNRFIAEAKFIRALSYYNLVTLFGGPDAIPLLLEPSALGQRAEGATPEAVYAQIEKDLTEAVPNLPSRYTGADVGRATSGAANGLLGKARLQQGKWAEAATAFALVVAPAAGYQLLPVYGDNFRAANDNNAESIFEVQFTDQNVLSQGSAGYSGPKLYGPCGPAFCDANPTRWYYNLFVASGDTTRLNATIFYNRGDTTVKDVFGRAFSQRYPDRLNDLFVKKYTQWYTSGDEFFDNPINFKVMRLGGVKLLYAEALNESGNQVEALNQVNAVRDRAKLPLLVGPLGETALRAVIEREQLLELGFEAERFRYLQRHDQLNPTMLQPVDNLTLVQHDPDFSSFVVGRAELLPVPNSETDLNTGVTQNPNY